jgi:glycosyltransferase involved in cell wall biosynthesis
LFGKKVVIQHHGYQAICPDGLLLDSRTQTSCDNSFQRGDVVNCFGCRAKNVGWLRGALSVALGYPRAWISKHASANVSVSNHVKSRLKLPASSTIYNGTAEPRVATPEPASHPIKPALPAFAFVGRLVREKGVDVLLRAAAQLARERKFRLKIIGDGPEREKLKALVNELNLLYVVEFFGWVQEPDLSAIIGDCAGIIMPSMCEEAAPLSAIEQMMRGKLIIASDIGGLSEMVGSTGLKFPAGNAHSLARCMELAIDDLELRRALSSAALLRARQLFSADRMITDHLKLYRDVLGKRRAPKRAYRSAPSEAWITSLSERLKSFITAT